MRRSWPRGALSRGANGLSVRRRELCTPAAQAAWARVQREAAEMEAKCPTFGLRSLVQGRVLRHETLSEGLSIELSQKLTANGNTYVDYEGAMKHALSENPQIADAAAADMEAFMRVDPAAEGFLGVYLFYKGFQALQCARVANYFWRRPDQGGRMFARLLQSEMSDVFGLGESSHPFHMPDAVLSPYATRRIVPMCHLGSFPTDIHPGAQFGRGITIEHGTGLVVGETVLFFCFFLSHSPSFYPDEEMSHSHSSPIYLTRHYTQRRSLAIMSTRWMN